MCIEAYAAGIIDGEGCINCRRNDRWGSGRWGYQLSVSVQMMDPSAITFLATNFGGRARGPNAIGAYSWSLSGARAIEFLKKIETYCTVKLPHIRFALLFTVTNKVPYSVDLEEREFIYRGLRGLNRKGPGASARRGIA